ncbi:MAG: hypothetical protein H7067_13555, partial [Burkholderiales bacterium]|nr:hypothetical protein [Opitutaceae bacterium]
MNSFGYLFLLTASLCATGLSAMDLQTLVDRSPFAPPASAAAASGPAEQPGTLEFRGIVVDEQGTSYSVFDATASRGYWLREGVDGPIRFKSYNSQETQLEVEQNGRPVKLQMKRATIQAGAAIVMAPPRAANTGPQPGGGPSVARNPGDPATDARRLEAV